ncbi:hypothetical protein [Gimesia sp.]|uniref:hypothetical protein n=1 Tax=Gimesia sp. TaxID=2024833 RepID=UPI003A91FCBF
MMMSMLDVMVAIVMAMELVVFDCFLVSLEGTLCCFVLRVDLSFIVKPTQFV